MRRGTMTPIGSLVAPISTWNPARANNGNFVYVDLSAIDQQGKRIVLPREIPCSEAPSRARQIIAANDVLVSTVRPNLNGVARVPKELDGATASTGFCVLRPEMEKLDPGFLYHWVKSVAFVNDMVRKATGANYPAVSDRIVHQSRIPLPPLSEQSRIAAILDQVESLRASRRESVEKLDALIDGVFSVTFGDPPKNSKGWPTLCLEDLSTKITDGEHLNPEFSNAGMPIVAAGDVLDDGVNLPGCNTVAQSLGEKFRRKCGPVAGDLLLVSRGATIGRLCEVNIDQPFCLMGSVILIKPHHDKIRTGFLRILLRHPVSRAALHATSGSSAQQAIYIKDLKRLRCWVPPLDVQDKFDEQLGQVNRMKAVQRRSLGFIDALFLSLQHRAFRGDL